MHYPNHFSDIDKMTYFEKLVVLQLCMFFLAIRIESSDIPLTQEELRTKYGQGIQFHSDHHFNMNFRKIHILFLENTSFNDGQSCYRECDGESTTCYYEFHVQVYDSMSG